MRILSQSRRVESKSTTMRIGIVNDTVLAREALRRVVLSSSEHEVVWTASDGGQAIALAREMAPDLILMDLFMPGIDGVEATRRIMGESPCAILIVTATVSGHLSKVYQAMGYGALDAIDTPTLDPRGEVERCGRAPAQDRPDRATDRQAGEAGEGWSRRESQAVASPDRAIAGSPGGPGRLHGRPAGARRDPRAASRATRGRDHHRPARGCGVRAGLGQWLAEQSRRPVTLIAEGHRPAAGEVLLSVTDDHLVLGEDRRLHYSPEPQSANYRPSVDVFFQSVARNWSRPGVAALLTGMFHDGAKGLLALRNLGWRTIAQDESSSIVWGMPKAAVEIGAAEEVLHLEKIAEGILRLLDKGHTAVGCRAQGYSYRTLNAEH